MIEKRNFHLHPFGAAEKPEDYRALFDEGDERRSLHDQKVQEQVERDAKIVDHCGRWEKPEREE